MKFSRLLAWSCLHSRACGVALNAAAWMLFPSHRDFYMAGIKRGLHRKPASRLGVLLAANPPKVPETRINKRV